MSDILIHSPEKFDAKSSAIEPIVSQYIESVIEEFKIAGFFVQPPAPVAPAVPPPAPVAPPTAFRTLRTPGVWVDRLSNGDVSILFGTDMPSYNLAKEKDEIRLTKQWVKLFQNLPQEARKYGVDFSQEEAELMAHGNAERIFKI